jgi:hypothetical protein
MKVWSKTKEFSEGKFLVVRRDGTTPDWPHFVMGARDPAVPHALASYANQADDLGFEPEYVASVRVLSEDFVKYRSEHGDGDPEAPPHRTDELMVLAMMRHEFEVRDVIAALCVIEQLAAQGGGGALPRIQAIARMTMEGKKARSVRDREAGS